LWGPAAPSPAAWDPGRAALADPREGLRAAMWQAQQGFARIPAKAATASPGDADAWASEDIVNQIKDLQRNNQTAKEQWIAFTDMHGQGTRDPSKHSAELLQGFLDQFNSGRMLPMHEDAAQLADVVKMLQKKSIPFRNVWAQYCQQFGAGKNDPAKHDPAYHVKFFEGLAEMASRSMQMPMMPFAAAEPPMKRLRLDADGGALAMSSGDPLKEKLVSMVKAYQRESVEQKETWARYVDTYHGGVRDPSRHETATLKEFVRLNIDASFRAAAPPSRPRLMLGAPGGGSSGQDQLVDRIKSFQKSSSSAKEAWSSFCGTTKDPARHDAARLQQFIDEHQVP